MVPDVEPFKFQIISGKTALISNQAVPQCQRGEGIREAMAIFDVSKFSAFDTRKNGGAPLEG